MARSGSSAHAAGPTAPHCEPSPSQQPFPLAHAGQAHLVGQQHLHRCRQRLAGCQPLALAAEGRRGERGRWRARWVAGMPGGSCRDRAPRQPCQLGVSSPATDAAQHHAPHLGRWGRQAEQAGEQSEQGGRNRPDAITAGAALFHVPSKHSMHTAGTARSARTTVSAHSSMPSVRSSTSTIRLLRLPAASAAITLMTCGRLRGFRYSFARLLGRCSRMRGAGSMDEGRKGTVCAAARRGAWGDALPHRTRACKFHLWVGLDAQLPLPSLQLGQVVCTAGQGRVVGRILQSPAARRCAHVCACMPRTGGHAPVPLLHVCRPSPGSPPAPNSNSPAPTPFLPTCKQASLHARRKLERLPHSQLPKVRVQGRDDGGGALRHKAQRPTPGPRQQAPAVVAQLVCCHLGAAVRHEGRGWERAWRAWVRAPTCACQAAPCTAAAAWASTVPPALTPPPLPCLEGRVTPQLASQGVQQHSLARPGVAQQQGQPPRLEHTAHTLQNGDHAGAQRRDGCCRLHWVGQAGGQAGRG